MLIEYPVTLQMLEKPTVNRS